MRLSYTYLARKQVSYTIYTAADALQCEYIMHDSEYQTVILPILMFTLQRSAQEVVEQHCHNNQNTHSQLPKLVQI